jgi:hypothetical protein
MVVMDVKFGYHTLYTDAIYTNTYLHHVRGHVGQCYILAGALRGVRIR